MKAVLRQKIDTILTRANLRKTRPRMAVLTVLLEEGKPVTVQRIITRLGWHSPDKVTIYRILESLVERGMVHKAFLRNKTWHFEPAADCTSNQCHPHFTCVSCGTTHCLRQLRPPLVKSPHRKFVIHRQRVQLEGLCPACAR
ncbi:MAG TPA: transcriptional repressor [Sedimentisphaerales bacterium]|nr:transcriptional repressor [Sedimentisphaerales bacterium]